MKSLVLKNLGKHACFSSLISDRKNPATSLLQVSSQESPPNWLGKHLQADYKIYLIVAFFRQVILGYQNGVNT